MKKRSKNRKTWRTAGKMMTGLLLSGSLLLTDPSVIFAEKAGLAELAGGQAQEEEISPGTEQEETVSEEPAQQSGGLGGLAGGSAAGSEENVGETGENDTPDTGTAPSEKKKQTLMIYLCGSNLESDGGAATTDITEILRSGYNTEEINVLAMVGGSTKWWGGFSSAETAIYELSGTNPKKVYGDQLLNMGEPETLTTLLEFCHENYPADQYALDLWDHGGGPMSGVCWDSLAKSDNLSMSELQSALESSFCKEEPLEWLGFDACLMASVETAFLISPYAKYMIASQETEPGCGWSYSFLKGMEEDANGGETGSRIVETYFAETPKSQAGQLTLSCIDLSKINEVQEQMDTFFSDLSIDLNEETFSALSNMRQGSRGFGRANSGEQDYDLVDLRDLTEHYREQDPEAADRLIDALDEAVVSTNSTMDGSHGLSVYHPYYNKTLYQQKWEEEYASFLFAPGYTQYLRSFAALWLGEVLGDWTRMMDLNQSMDEEENAVFSLPLSEEQQETYASAQMLVLEEIDYSDSSAYTSVYVSDEVEIDEEGTLSAQYSGKALYAIDEEGNPISGTLNYRVVDGKYIIYVYFSDEFMGDGLLGYYSCEPAEDSDQLQIVSLYIYDEVTDQYTNRLEPDLSDYTEVYFIKRDFVPTYDGEILKAFEDWEKSPGFAAEYIDLSERGVQFAFFEEQLTESQKYVTFQITDTQANTHSSELQKVENLNVREIAISPDTIEGDGYVLHVSAQMNESKLEPGVQIFFDLENQFEREYSFEMEQLVINGCRGTSDRSGSWTTWILESGAHDSKKIEFKERDLTNLTEISTFDGTLRFSPRGDYSAEDVTVPLHFTLEDADVSGFAPQESEQPMAVAVQGEMTCELYHLEEEENGELSAILHWINASEEERNLGNNGCVNDVVLPIGSGSYERVPGNADLWQQIVLENRETSFGYESANFKKNHILQSMGVTEISSLTLYDTYIYNDYKGVDAEKYFFELEEPMPYRASADEVEPEEKKLLLEENGVQVNLISVEVLDDDSFQRISLLIEVENTTDHTMELVMNDYKEPALIGDQEASVVSSGYGDPYFAGTRRYEYLQVYQSEYDIKDGTTQPVKEFQNWQFNMEVKKSWDDKEEFHLSFTLDHMEQLYSESGYRKIPLDQVTIDVTKVEEE